LAHKIQTAASKIEELVAFIEKAESDVQELGVQIGELDTEINKLEVEKKEATDDRTAQHAEYLKVSQDYAESVDALARAIQVLSTQALDRAQADSLLQKMAQTVKGMPRVLGVLLQQQDRAKSSNLRGDGAPAVAAYESQSGGLVEMLEGLLDKFKKELGDVEQGEADEAHAFALAELHLSNTIARESSDRDEKTSAKGQRAEESAKAKGELAAATEDKASDEKLKADIEATFRVKSSAFEENQKVHAAELEAIGKEVEILSSPDVQQNYAKNLGLVQAGGHIKATRAASFLQLRRRTRRGSGSNQAKDFLKKQAKALHSKALTSLVSQIAANPLPDKLKEEAIAEADHKAWCDKELKDNKEKSDKKTAEADELNALIEGKTAEIADQGARIATLSQEQADLATAMSQATEFRGKEKAENVQTIAEAVAGAEAVKRAVVVLKEFYEAQAAPAAALLQQKHKQVPEKAAYKGMQSSTGGVVGMLEVIESDFSRLKADTESNEHAAAAEYDRFMKESEASKKEKRRADEVAFTILAKLTCTGIKKQGGVRPTVTCGTCRSTGLCGQWR